MTPCWMIDDNGRRISAAVCKLLGMTLPSIWKPIKRQGKWYTYDLHWVLVTSDYPPPDLSEWLDEHAGKDNWKFKIVWLHNPVDGDIPMYRFYFPNLETLTQFKLVWQDVFK